METWKIWAGLFLLVFVLPSCTGIGLGELLLGLMPLLFVAVGVIALFTGVTVYRRSRYVQDLPTSSVQGAATGLTEIKGTVMPAEETFSSPFANRECVLCQYALRQPPQSGDDGISVLPLDYGVVGVPFYVKDETGQILVRPEGADVRIPYEIQDLSGYIAKSDESAFDPSDRRTLGRGTRNEDPVAHFGEVRKEFYEQYGLTDRLKGMVALYKKTGGSDRHRSLPEGPLVYGEARLEPGDSVYVLGTAHTRDPSHDESSPNGNPHLVIRSNPTTTTGSGPIGTLLARLLSVGDYLPMSSDYRSIYVISSEDEDDLIASWRRKLWTQLLGGSFILILGVITAVLIFQ